MHLFGFCFHFRDFISNTKTYIAVPHFLFVKSAVGAGRRLNSIFMDTYSFMEKKQKEQIAIEKQMHQKSSERSKGLTTKILLFLFVIMSVFLFFVALIKTLDVDEKLQTFQAQSENQLKEQNRDIVFIMGKNFEKSSFFKDENSNMNTVQRSTNEKKYEWIRISEREKKVWLEGMECELLTPVEKWTTPALSFLGETLERQGELQSGEFNRIINSIINDESRLASSRVYSFKGPYSGIIFYESNTIYVLTSVFGTVVSVITQTATKIII